MPTDTLVVDVVPPARPQGWATKGAINSHPITRRRHHHAIGTPSYGVVTEQDPPQITKPCSLAQNLSLPAGRDEQGQELLMKGLTEAVYPL